MSNIWEHPQIIAAEALRHLEDSLVIGPLCARDTTSEFTNKANGWKVGDTVSFRTHGEYAVTDFDGQIVPQNISTSSRSMQIEKHYDVSVEVTAREMALDLDTFSEQVIRPATYKLAETVDAFLGTKILQGAGLYASPALFTTAADIAQARKAAILQQLAMDRFCLVDLDTEATLLGQDWFNQSDKRGLAGEATMNSAIMGKTMGMDWYSSVAFPTADHTASSGTAATNNTVATDNQIGSRTLVVTSITGGFTAGDRIAVAGLRRPLIVATTVAALELAIPLVDPITELVPDGAAVTVVGSGKVLTYQGAIFDSRSLGVAFPMLDLPEDRVAATSSNNGVSIRIVKGYDLQSKKTTMSLDLLCGSFMLDPRRCTLVASYPAT